MAMIFLWLLARQIAPNAREIAKANQGMNLGYAHAGWKDTGIIEYISRNPIGDFILSNDIYPLYIHTDRTDIYRSLPLYITNDIVNEAIMKFANERNQQSQRFENVADSFYVVWFYDLSSNIRFDYRAPDLRALPELKIVEELNNGVIFKVDRSAGDDAKPYRSMYESLVSGEPMIRSDFNLYVGEHALTYIREPCSLTDMDPRFFLHVIPAEANDLPDDRQRYGFENFDFHFSRNGARFDGKCLVTVDLPDYAIARIRTGQYVSGEAEIWKAEFSLHRGQD